LARKPIEIIKPVAALILFLAAWWILPVAVRSFTRTSLHEFQAPATLLHSRLLDLQSFWALRNQSKEELIEAGRDLARLNAAYQVRLQQMDTVESSLERLEQLLHLRPEPEYHYLVARVARRDINLWWQRLVIRKGSADGIRENAAVVYAGGVVGRVREVNTHTAVVELVSSHAFRMAARFEGDDRPVIYQGGVTSPGELPSGTVRDVPNDLEVPRGQSLRLVSSSLGGAFPDGLTLGRVNQLEPGSDGLFQYGTVILNQDLYSLREVAVVIPLKSDETWTNPPATP
jgi:rod shape-determining protein MreC